jgi:capsular polysaccharide biosynthesis protein
MKYTKIIEFSDIKVSLLAVMKNIRKCFVCGFVFLILGILLTLGMPVDNIYSASSTLYCPINANYSEATTFVQIISSYSSLIKSQKVAERAISILGSTELTYKDIIDMISYSTSVTGINLTITANSVDEEESLDVANAVANAFVEEMRTMTGMDVVQILSAADEAEMSQNGIVALWKLRAALFVAGLLIMAVVIFASELFSDKIRSSDQCILTDDDVVLGLIPEVEEIHEK